MQTLAYVRELILKGSREGELHSQEAALDREWVRIMQVNPPLKPHGSKAPLPEK